MRNFASTLVKFQNCPIFKQRFGAPLRWRPPALRGQRGPLLRHCVTDILNKYLPQSSLALLGSCPKLQLSHSVIEELRYLPSAHSTEIISTVKLFSLNENKNSMKTKIQFHFFIQLQSK